MHAPMLLLAGRTLFPEFKKKGLKEFEPVRTILSEATDIFSQVEDPAKTEGAMCVAAVQALEQIQQWISSFAFDST